MMMTGTGKSACTAPSGKPSVLSVILAGEKPAYRYLLSGKQKGPHIPNHPPFMITILVAET